MFTYSKLVLISQFSGIEGTYIDLINLPPSVVRTNAVTVHHSVQTEKYKAKEQDRTRQP